MRRALYTWLLTLMALCATSAQALAQASVASEPERGAEQDQAQDQAQNQAPAPVMGYTQATRAPDEGRAASTVTREDLQERQPRSAPDALRYEPGVSVQQTAHSQGSAYIRGRTGQQTVLLFDDIRLNNSLFRQGPNQYFFTIDARTIHHIDVVRGSASTRYGTDAISGAINAVPIDPRLDAGVKGWALRPSAMARLTTADDERGGRLQLEAQWAEHLAVLAGVGYRTVGRLTSGGIVTSPLDGSAPEVPRFEADGRTMLGTGFDELAADVRLVAPLGPGRRATAAYYDYRQLDAPRTDNCPPPEAPFNECLKYDEQFRQLAYVAIDGDWGAAARSSRLILSYQRQHERRTQERPSSFTINGGRDDVASYGALWRAQTARAALGSKHSAALRWGADAYHDRIESVAWLIFTDNDIVLRRSRGQYMDGSRYTTMGGWAELDVRLWDQLNLRAGGRASHLRVDAGADAESATRAVSKRFWPLVGNVGLEWWATEWLTLLATADQGFRAPNLDDLTSRQRTGPGFQLENADLTPESGWTTELGARLTRGPLQVDLWAYRATLDDAIARVNRQVDSCPPNTPDCRSSRTYLQLINLDGTAMVWGAEGGVKLSLPYDLRLATTLSWAWGDTPPPDGRGPRVPLSRVPPLNGTVEALYRAPQGLYAGASMRWSARQDRLALSDLSDPRIPRGGTPGFAMMDLRAGYRFIHNIQLNVVFENLLDTAYRVHGSSVNGPGRGLILNLEGGL